jgi:hypothetical protein
MSSWRRRRMALRVEKRYIKVGEEEKQLRGMLESIQDEM